MYSNFNTVRVIVNHRSKPTDWILAATAVGLAGGILFVGEKIKNRLDVVLKKLASPSEVAKVAIADRASVLRPKKIVDLVKGLFNKKED